MADAAETKPQARDLNSAVLECFSPNMTSPPFENRLLDLTMALTTSKDVAIWANKGGDEGISLVVAGTQATTDETTQRNVQDFLSTASTNTPALSASGPFILATVALPAGLVGALCIGLPPGGQLARTLAFERATMLSNLSFSQNKHEDLTAQSNMIHSLRSIGSGDTSAMQDLVDQISKLTGAQYCAAGTYRGGAISDLAVSGQENFTKRAQLPVKLKASMREAAQNGVNSSLVAYAPRRDGQTGLVLALEGATRNTEILPMAATIYSQSATGKPRSKWTSGRLIKLGAMALIVLGIGLVPVPDGVDVSAQVTATEKRIVTAPLNATLSSVDIKDSERVVAGETVLASLDTSEIELNLIATRSERATAILERETARANRNAALLRNAELEVERLEARVSLLEFEKSQGTLKAPIDGIVVLGGLEERLGASVRAGDTLLQIIDPQEFHLELSILESQISKLSEGSKGVFRPDFDPSIRLDAEITSISPALSLTEEAPSVQGKAQFETPPEGLRFGLKGVFAVERAYRPIWNILYTNLRDWALLRVWL